MTDGKGAGEGPYTYYERADARFIIEGPGVHMDGGAEHLTRNEVSRLNMVFALGLQRSCTAGRMVAEKDFKKLLAMAGKLRGFDNVFDSWKKARGIE